MKKKHGKGQKEIGIIKEENRGRKKIMKKREERR